MSYTYLQEQGEESSAESFSDIPVYVLSKLNLTAEKSSCNGNGMESCQSSQSGMMSERSTENPGKEKSMSCAEGSHVQILVAESKTQKELTGPGVDYGEKWQELFLKYNPDSHMWKTHLCLLSEDLPWYSLTLPKWGMLRDGELYRLPNSERHTSETECGYVPTPTSRDYKGCGKHGRIRGGGNTTRHT